MALAAPHGEAHLKWPPPPATARPAYHRGPRAPHVPPLTAGAPPVHRGGALSSLLRTAEHSPRLDRHAVSLEAVWAARMADDVAARHEPAYLPDSLGNSMHRGSGSHPVEIWSNHGGDSLASSQLLPSHGGKRSEVGSDPGVARLLGAANATRRTRPGRAAAGRQCSRWC